MNWRAILAIALGGGVGAMLRYVVSVTAAQRFGPGLPLGTLIVNLTGCLAIGIVSELAQTRAVGMSPLTRVFLTVGVLGGFTTFSSFALELVTLAGERAQLLALGYALVSVVLGFAAAYAGIVAVRLIHL